ncbi:hypothetical protein R3P38DRAFT_3431692 [Favolaschia claudopus]|uniref:Uncharacterized protein n=1 Tax=Favolaschia claudopus TaxID=2862362 RepID=A0AAW0D0P0_9AGAR
MQLPRGLTPAASPSPPPVSSSPSTLPATSRLPSHLPTDPFQLCLPTPLIATGRREGRHSAPTPPISIHPRRDDVPPLHSHRSCIAAPARLPTVVTPAPLPDATRSDLDNTPSRQPPHALTPPLQAPPSSPPLPTLELSLLAAAHSTLNPFKTLPRADTALPPLPRSSNNPKNPNYAFDYPSGRLPAPVGRPNPAASRSKTHPAPKFLKDYLASTPSTSHAAAAPTPPAKPPAEHRPVVHTV